MRDDVGQVSIADLPIASDRERAWHQLLEAGPVADCAGQLVLANADAVEFAAKHPELFSSAHAFDRLASPLPLIPIAIDPPDHARYRRLLNPTFAPTALRRKESELRGQIRELVDAAAEKETLDLMLDVAIPFPSQVFLTLFGLPLEDRDRLLLWKDAILSMTDPANPNPAPAVVEQALELHAYLQRTVSERRAAGAAGPDLLSELIAIRAEGGLTDDEIIGLCFLFVLAGLDTVTASIGFAFDFLARSPEVRAGLVADPASIPNFVEELLRLHGPVPFSPRVTTGDVEVCGSTVPAGTEVMLAWLAANRDPDRFDASDSLCPGRTERHFAFGSGPHKCLGSSLARLELRLVLEEWHRRIPDYELADGAAPQPKWPAGTLVLRELPLVIRPTLGST